MTLILTFAAATVATAILLARPACARAHRLGMLALMYWAAGLMWCVDGIANVLSGEPFVELAYQAAMADDALLGACVIALGLAVWAVAGRVRPQRVAA